LSGFTTGGLSSSAEFHRARISVFEEMAYTVALILLYLRLFPHFTYLYRVQTHEKSIIVIQSCDPNVGWYMSRQRALGAQHRVITLAIPIVYKVEEEAYFTRTLRMNIHESSK
jgi:hypothetical protein